MNAGSTAPRRHRRAEIATLLSFAWPGLGQWYAGRRRAAALFAVPLTAAVVVVALAAVADIERVAVRLFEPGVAVGAFALVLAAGAIRLAAMVHAAAVTEPTARVRGRAAALLVVLAVVVVGVHGGLAAIAWSFHAAQQAIFVADPVAPAPTPSAAAATHDPGATPPEATPEPTVAPPGRINVLIAGIDSAPSRTTLLTDTLIVVSLDPSTGDVVMVSFPRDIARFPLWDGRTYTGKINELYAWARRHPEEFPDGGMATITREVGYLLGIDVEHYASVDMGGFERMIDEVGGVTIVNERAINDPSYGGWRDGRVGFRLPAGRHTLNGQAALAYVRSRKGAGDNDFSRARRQQQVLVALAAKLSDPGMVPRLPGILDAASRTVSTNFPAQRLGEMLELGRRLDDEDVRHVVLGPPYATHPPTSTTGGVYTLSLDLDKVADLSIELFGDASRYAEAGAPG